MTVLSNMIFFEDVEERPIYKERAENTEDMSDSSPSEVVDHGVTSLDIARGQRMHDGRVARRRPSLCGRDSIQGVSQDRTHLKQQQYRSGKQPHLRRSLCSRVELSFLSCGKLDAKISIAFCSNRSIKDLQKDLQVPKDRSVSGYQPVRRQTLPMVANLQ